MNNTYVIINIHMNNTYVIININIDMYIDVDIHKYYIYNIKMSLPLHIFLYVRPYLELEDLLNVALANKVLGDTVATIPRNVHTLCNILKSMDKDKINYYLERHPNFDKKQFNDAFETFIRDIFSPGISYRKQFSDVIATLNIDHDKYMYLFQKLSSYTNDTSDHAFITLCRAPVHMGDHTLTKRLLTDIADTKGKITVPDTLKLLRCNDYNGYSVYKLLLHMLDAAAQEHDIWMYEYIMEYIDRKCKEGVLDRGLIFDSIMGLFMNSIMKNGNSKIFEITLKYIDNPKHKPFIVYMVCASHQTYIDLAYEVTRDLVSDIEVENQIFVESIDVDYMLNFPNFWTKSIMTKLIGRFVTDYDKRSIKLTGGRFKTKSHAEVVLEQIENVKRHFCKNLYEIFRQIEIDINDLPQVFYFADTELKSILEIKYDMPMMFSCSAMKDTVQWELLMSDIHDTLSFDDIVTEDECMRYVTSNTVTEEQIDIIIDNGFTKVLEILNIL